MVGNFMALSPELQNRIESLLASDQIVLFMKGTKEQPQCGFSATVVEILNQLVPHYTTVNVLADLKLREGIKEFSSWPTIPQLYIRKEFIGGCDIVKELFSSGEIFDVLNLPKTEVKILVLTITPSAQEAFRNALKEASPDEHIRLKINADFKHDLSFSQKYKSDIEVSQNGITLLFDPISAQRANNLIIDFTTNKMGSGFEINNPNALPPVKEMSVKDLKQKLDNQEKFFLFDVRTQDEWDISRIPGATLMLNLPQHELDSIDKDALIVFQCRSGGRSMRKAEEFRQKGFRNVYNLTGGIRAYASEIDSSLPVS